MSSNQKPAPTVSSTDREERIAARRARIQARIEAKKRAQGEENAARTATVAQTDDPMAGLTGAQLQVYQSRRAFLDAQFRAMEEVSAGRVDALHKEQQRRKEEVQRRAEQRSRREDEKIRSEQANEEIAERWSEIIQMEIPEDLAEEIRKQKALCDEVIASKDALIREWHNEIKAKEDDYVKALSKQAEDIDDILAKMRQQNKDLVASYERETSEIEEAFLLERAALRQQLSADLEASNELRRNNEVKYMELRHDRNEEITQQLDDLRVFEAEEYNELKIKLETEIQALEQQLQEMKATFQLNNEKLEHNFRLLGEREFEHNQLIQQQKKKINRLQDMLSTLKAKYLKSDKQYRSRNIEITEEYKRVTEQYQELQTKFRQVQERIRRKYTEVWEMDRERVAVLVKRILKADKTITEQQLGYAWFPPTEDIFKFNVEAVAPVVSENPGAAVLSRRVVQRDSPVFNDNMKQVVSLICDGAGFLVDGKVRSLLDGLQTDDRNMIKIESIMESLGVESHTAAESLLSYFIDGIDSKSDPQLISPADAARALKAFVTDHQSKIKEANLEKITITEEEKLEKQQKAQEREYWERLSKVVADKQIHVWKSLEAELVKYNAVLQERAKLVEDTEAIRKQNDELKQLLNQYLGSTVNDQLQVPPITVHR
eukprot:TRINITY_DN3584_c0_g1_i1.p1 TRINITY_DN3584_c0_g1~~TRINITY_DN3584_c0_g1_i1.p1  ORF type:complete len:660 (-),score=312.37 TRINITY_DN3584_c0_g1_i1:391-2370(-)